MVRKSKQLSRILKVQVDLRKEAEARLAQVNARRDELHSAQAFILEMLASEDPCRRALAPIAGERLRGIDRDLKDLDVAHAAAQAHWRRLAQRSLVAERLHKAAHLAETRDMERKNLETLLADVESRRTSLP